MRCPTCRQMFGDDAAAPFCSERCRLIDLGNWLGGRYVIAGDEKVAAAVPVEIDPDTVDTRPYPRAP